MVGRLPDNVVVLTGASSGIGRALAPLLAGEGARLVLAARRVSHLEELRELLLESDVDVEIVPTDVTDEAQCRALVERCIERFGRLDTLIVNAGRTLWARFDEMETLEPFEELMRVNYFGAVYCTHYALPHLVESRGRIVGVSSLTGKTGVPHRSGYAATKHAMVGFFDTLRIELLESGVTVTMIYPDYVATETRERAFGADGKEVGESPVQEGRIMSAEECARRILEATIARQRELIPSVRGRVGQWLKVIAPGLVDRIALRAVRRGR